MVRRKPGTFRAVTERLVSGDLRAKPCPICNRPSDTAFHPFCSARCTDIDLHRWLGGTYAVPSTAVETDEDDFNPGRDHDGG